MYIPKAFEIDDPTVTLAFMQAHNFATLVSHGPNGLEASHLPFIVRRSERARYASRPPGPCQSPMAALRWLEEALVIFRARTPTSHRPSTKRTRACQPGTTRSCTRQARRRSSMTREGVRAHVLALIAQHEEGSQTPWSPKLPENYLQSMLRQIVAIRIEVTKVETKFKLGQNRSRVDRESMAGWFASSDDPMLQALGNATLATLGVESFRATLPRVAQPGIARFQRPALPVLTPLRASRRQSTPIHLYREKVRREPE